MQAYLTAIKSTLYNDTALRDQLLRNWQGPDHAIPTLMWHNCGATAGGYIKELIRTGSYVYLPHSQWQLARAYVIDALGVNEILAIKYDCFGLFSAWIDDHSCCRHCEACAALEYS